MSKTLGVYIHIPFCAGKCAYCDFYSLAGHDELIPQYDKALVSHIKESSMLLYGYSIDSVYFGGGTPTHYGAQRLIKILGALKKYGHLSKNAEITVEANPESTSFSDLIHMRKAGFNRISFGVQSADDGLLKSLGRLHTFEKAEEAFYMARNAGFKNINIDLIYGLPSQTREGWSDTLAKAAALQPEHFSCYGLKIEPGTPLYEFKDSPFIPDDDTQADMYLYTVEALERFGYRQYEISNFSRRGFESKHNLKYWQGGEYIGFGAAAHSFVGSERYSNISDITEYISNIETGKSVVDYCETINDFEKSGEYLMLGLRTVYGISEEEYRTIYKCSFEGAKKLFTDYKKQGWMTENNGRWSFTPKGFLISNTLIGNILEEQTKQRFLAGTPWKQTELEDVQIELFESQLSTPLFNGMK